MKYSLATLLLLTAVVALGMAGLVNATPLWTQIVVTSVVLTLIGATVVAVHSRQARPFVSGFALAGWAYFLLTTTAIGGTARNNLVTTTALTKLYPVLHEAEATNPQAAYTVAYRDFLLASVNQQFIATPNPGPESSRFHSVGHSLWAMLVGSLGGMLAISVQRRRQGVSLAGSDSGAHSTA